MSLASALETTYERTPLKYGVKTLGPVTVSFAVKCPREEFIGLHIISGNTELIPLSRCGSHAYSNVDFVHDKSGDS